MKMKKNRLYLVLIIITIPILVILLSNRKTSILSDAMEVNANNVVYDVALFWGQSNMVGQCSSTAKDIRVTGDNAVFRNYLSAAETSMDKIELFSQLTKIDKDLIEKYTKYNHVNLPMVSVSDGGNLNTVFYFSHTTYINNSSSSPMIPITSATETVGEKLVWGTLYNNSYISCANDDAIAHGLCNNSNNRKLMKCTSNPKGENEVYCSSYPSVQSSGGTNMIPEFGRQYYEKTGHKLIVVMAANGGEELANYLPHNEIINYSPTVSSMNEKSANQFIYESMVKQYVEAMEYLNSKGYKIGNKFYVFNQGRDVRYIKDSLDNSSPQYIDPQTGQPYNKNSYKTIFMTIHNKLKQRLDLDFGVIVESGITTGSADGYLKTGALESIHNARLELASENNDIIMGSSFSYNNFVPKTKSEYNTYRNLISDKFNGRNFESALEISYLSLCVTDPSFDASGNIEDDGKSNAAHFNSAAYSQIGRETALLVTDYLSHSVKYHSNGGTGTIQNQIVYSGTEFILSANVFTREGYTFNGWNTKADGSGTSYSDLQTISGITSDLNLYAQWKANTYKVVFNANNGVGNMGNQSFTYGISKKLNTNSFTREGYTFNGWNTKADGSGTKYENGQNVSNLTAVNNGTVTLYAQWKIIEYTITYNLAGGILSNPKITYNVEDTTFTLGKPTKTGYTFTGWTGSNGNNLQTTVTISKGSTGNKTYNANYKANKYTVTFDSNGGSEPNPKTVSKEYNTAIGQLPTSTKTGYKLKGWFTSKTSGTEVTSSTLVTKNVTYYAIWTPIKYKIRYDSNTGIGTMADDEFTYGVSSALSNNLFTKENYIFNGWNSKKDGSGVVYSDGQNVSNLSSTENGVVVLYAQWIQGEYTISYNLAGGRLTKNNKTAYYSTDETFTLNNPLKEGHIFTGWTGSNGSTPQVTVTIPKGSSGNMSFLANYRKNSYTIKFEYGDIVKEQTLEYGSNITIDPPEIEKTGYTLIGWYDDDGNEFDKNVTVGASNRAYKPRFNANTYRIVFDSNGGTGSMDVQMLTYDNKANLLSNSYSRSGYTFSSWNTEIDGSGKSYSNGEQVLNLLTEDDEEMVLYAIWKLSGNPPTSDDSEEADSQEKKEEQEDVKNPETGAVLNIVLILFLSIIGIILYRLASVKNKFKKV